MGVEKKAGIIIYVLIGILVVFAIFIVIKEKDQFSGFYRYSNGDSEFEVKAVSVGKSLQYEIKVFFPDDPKPYIISTRYDPLNLENISIDRRVKQIIADDKLVYVAIDPEENLTGKTTLAALEIDKFIDNYRFYNIPVNSAMTKPYKGNKVMGCSNATDEITVIWLRKGDTTSVFSEGNCIIVQGKGEEELIRAADRLSLLLIGVMR